MQGTGLESGVESWAEQQGRVPWVVRLHRADTLPRNILFEVPVPSILEYGAGIYNLCPVDFGECVHDHRRGCRILEDQVDEIGRGAVPD